MPLGMHRLLRSPRPRRYLTSPQLSTPQCDVWASAIGLAIEHCEATSVHESPASGDRGDGFVPVVGGQQLVVGVVQSDPAKVLQRRGVQVPPEHVLHGARCETDIFGDITQADVLVGIGLDELDGPAQQHGRVILAVIRHRIRDGRIGKGRQGDRGQQAAGDIQYHWSREGLIGQHHFLDIADCGLPQPLSLRIGRRRRTLKGGDRWVRQFSPHNGEAVEPFMDQLAEWGGESEGPDDARAGPVMRSANVANVARASVAAPSSERTASCAT
jgi:hypothetical protein